jgi:hypothetical protein
MLIFKGLTHSEFFGQLIQRFKYGIDSPSRLNIDYPAAINTIVSNTFLAYSCIEKYFLHRKKNYKVKDV